jgi:hypothetical protein
MWKRGGGELFDAPIGVQLAKHTFVGARGDYYEIDDRLPQSGAY